MQSQSKGKVLPEWIDHNGHMNLAYYVLAFDLATDKFFDGFGIKPEQAIDLVERLRPEREDAKPGPDGVEIRGAQVDEPRSPAGSLRRGSRAPDPPSP